MGPKFQICKERKLYNCRKWQNYKNYELEGIKDIVRQPLRKRSYIPYSLPPPPPPSSGF